jgi:hypothetical protein
MKYARSFVSNTILFFLFNGTELIDANPSIQKFNMYDDIEDYLVWSERRVEALFCECSNRSWAPATIMRRVDQKLLQIFPFLTRIVDRSYVIERFMTALELFDAADDEAPRFSTEAEPPVAEAAAPEEPGDVAAPEPINDTSDDSNLLPKTPPSTPQTSSEQLQPPSLAEALRQMRAEPDLPVEACPPPEKLVNLDQSVYKLRRIAYDLGLKNAFSLSKKQAVDKLGRYNAGLLTQTELRG